MKIRHLNPRQMISYVSCHDDMCLADRLKATLPRSTKQERAKLHKMALTAVFASRGIPFLWCGDELMRDRKGVHNCYQSPDSVNAIPWKLKVENRDVFDYVCQLIQLRKATHWSQFPVRFLPVAKSCVMASQHGDDYIVVLNSNRSAVAQQLPEGEWKPVLTTAKLPATVRKKLKLPARSATILQRVSAE
ncbi:MAG: hypothetical protein HUK02_08765 [Bacteroidaceae bacterium]|nr:hypothetical protein [Bacteroidaceae bacterium]